MNEQEIAKIVRAVLDEHEALEQGQEAGHGEYRQEEPGHQGRHRQKEPGHVCKCKDRKMTLAKANALIEKVQGQAAQMGLSVVVAVADAAGRPVSVQSMDGAYIASFDIALNKSFTSASLKMSTQKLGTLSQPGESLYGIQFTNGGKIVIFGGGETLEVDGQIVGAIGVSGGSADEDTSLAAYGKECFERR